MYKVLRLIPKPNDAEAWDREARHPARAKTGPQETRLQGYYHTQLRSRIKLT